MAFWIRKQAGRVEERSQALSKNRGNTDKSKKDSSNRTRLNAMRVSERQKVTISSFGSPLQYEFTTRDISTTGVFILCNDLEPYPFQQTSTMLDCMLHLPEGHSKVRFMAKIARILYNSPESEQSEAGVGLKIVQLLREDLKVLEQFIMQRANEGRAEAMGPEGRKKVEEEESKESEQENNDTEKKGRKRPITPASTHKK